jgi:phosphoribosylaminoimidazole carboxylase
VVVVDAAAVSALPKHVSVWCILMPYALCLLFRLMFSCCSVEMFLLPDGGIFLNEVAPRPHNSGHYTQNGCVSSQFENHVRAVLGWPLGDTSLNCGCCIMLNLLGEADGDEGVRLAHEKMAAAYKTPGASVHW